MLSTYLSYLYFILKKISGIFRFVFFLPLEIEKETKSHPWKFCKIMWISGNTNTKNKDTWNVDGKLHMIFSWSLIFLYPTWDVIQLLFIFCLTPRTFDISVFYAECPWNFHVFKSTSFWNIRRFLEICPADLNVHWIGVIYKWWLLWIMWICEFINEAS